MGSAGHSPDNGSFIDCIIGFYTMDIFGYGWGVCNYDRRDGSEVCGAGEKFEVFGYSANCLYD